VGVKGLPINAVDAHEMFDGVLNEVSVPSIFQREPSDAADVLDAVAPQSATKPRRRWMPRSSSYSHRSWHESRTPLAPQMAQIPAASLLC